MVRLKAGLPVCFLSTSCLWASPCLRFGVMVCKLSRQRHQPPHTRSGSQPRGPSSELSAAIVVQSPSKLWVSACWHLFFSNSKFNNSLFSPLHSFSLGVVATSSNCYFPNNLVPSPSPTTHTFLVIYLTLYLVKFFILNLLFQIFWPGCYIFGGLVWGWGDGANSDNASGFEKGIFHPALPRSAHGALTEVQLPRVFSILQTIMNPRLTGINEEDLHSGTLWLFLVCRLLTVMKIGKWIFSSSCHLKNTFQFSLTFFFFKVKAKNKRNNPCLFIALLF